jgi:hypothetical protein
MMCSFDCYDASGDPDIGVACLALYHEGARAEN